MILFITSPQTRVSPPVERQIWALQFAAPQGRPGVRIRRWREVGYEADIDNENCPGTFTALSTPVKSRGG